MSYQAFAYCKESVNIDQVLDTLKTSVLHSKQISYTPKLKKNTDNEIEITFKNWQLVVGLNSTPQVKDETGNLLIQLPNDLSRSDILAHSQERLEIVSDIDFDDSHLEDYLALVEGLKNVPGMVVVDPRERSYL